jgi:hypothetical protein
MALAGAVAVPPVLTAENRVGSVARLMCHLSCMSRGHPLLASIIGY